MIEDDDFLQNDVFMCSYVGCTLLCTGSLWLRRVGLLSSCGTQAQLSCGRWNPLGQGSDPCPLHQQADSQPLDLCGSEKMLILMAEMGTDLVAGTAQV